MRASAASCASMSLRSTATAVSSASSEITDVSRGPTGRRGLTAHPSASTATALSPRRTGSNSNERAPVDLHHALRDGRIVPRVRRRSSACPDRNAIAAPECSWPICDRRAERQLDAVHGGERQVVVALVLPQALRRCSRASSTVAAQMLARASGLVAMSLVTRGDQAQRRLLFQQPPFAGAQGLLGVGGGAAHPLVDTPRCDQHGDGSQRERRRSAPLVGTIASTRRARPRRPACAGPAAGAAGRASGFLQARSERRPPGGRSSTKCASAQTRRRLNRGAGPPCVVLPIARYATTKQDSCRGRVTWVSRRCRGARETGGVCMRRPPGAGRVGWESSAVSTAGGGRRSAPTSR